MGGACLVDVGRGEVVAVADVGRPRLEIGAEEAERLVVALGVVLALNSLTAT